jgi:hypothetical protein
VPLRGRVAIFSSDYRGHSDSVGETHGVQVITLVHLTNTRLHNRRCYTSSEIGRR